MKSKYFALIANLVIGLTLFSVAQAQTPQPATQEMPPPRAKDGKKLLTALDLMRINGVSGPRISPDGAWVAYTVSSTKTEKDKEWKSTTQVWVASTKGGPARQFTRGEKNSGAPEWSPDGKTLAFLSDREKDGERQVWAMAADGGEAWAVTSEHDYVLANIKRIAESN